MSITYIPDFRLPIVDDEGRQTQEFNEWIRQVSALVEEAVTVLGSTEYASAYWDDNTESTATTTQDEWVNIAGSLVESVSTQNFAISGNTFTWNGERKSFLLSMSASSTDSSSGFDAFELGFSIGGTTRPERMDLTNHISRESVTSINQIVTFGPGDVFVPQMRATSNTPFATVVPTINISFTPIDLSEEIVVASEYIAAYWVNNGDTVVTNTQNEWVDIPGTLVVHNKTNNWSTSGDALTWIGPRTVFSLAIDATITDNNLGATANNYEFGYRVQGSTQAPNMLFTPAGINRETVSLTDIISIGTGETLIPQLRLVGTGTGDNLQANTLTIVLTSLI